ncbi:MAG: hypothetical protein Q4D93_03190 [Porphyromonas sp.]|nr:hypothetical protein [Porphyromonas sp.]
MDPLFIYSLANHQQGGTGVLRGTTVWTKEGVVVRDREAVVGGLRT